MNGPNNVLNTPGPTYIIPTIPQLASRLPLTPFSIHTTYGQHVSVPQTPTPANTLHKKRKRVVKENTREFLSHHRAGSHAGRKTGVWWEFGGTGPSLRVNKMSVWFCLMIRPFVARYKDADAWKESLIYWQTGGRGNTRDVLVLLRCRGRVYDKTKSDGGEKWRRTRCCIDRRYETQNHWPREGDSTRQEGSDQKRQGHNVHREMQLCVAWGKTREERRWIQYSNIATIRYPSYMLDKRQVTAPNMVVDTWKFNQKLTRPCTEILSHNSMENGIKMSFVYSSWNLNMKWMTSFCFSFFLFLSHSYLTWSHRYHTYQVKQKLVIHFIFKVQDEYTRLILIPFP